MTELTAALVALVNEEAVKHGEPLATCDDVPVQDMELYYRHAVILEGWMK